MRRAGLWCLLAASLSVACGVRPSSAPEHEVAPDGEVTMLLDADLWKCPTPRPFEEAEAALRPGQAPSDRVEVVVLSFAELCTDAGGHYALAASTVGTRRYWVGAPGCRIWEREPLPDGSFGVIRVQQTAGLIAAPAGSCVSFPGETHDVSSDSFTRALAAFRTEDAARRFATRFDN